MTVSTFAPDFDYNDASKTLNVDKVDVVGASFEAADGTTPFTVISTTKVTNLNADKIDGLDSTDFLKVANNLSDITNAGTARTNLVLGNVDNTADAAKPVSTAAQAALDLKAPLASPAFTGTVTGVTKTMVGLGSVDNTADAAKPVSTAAQAALDLKAPLASPTFTGTVTVPAPVNSTDASTKGYADALKQGLDIKDSVRVASTVNIPILTGLVNLSVIDGVTVSTGDRVLLKNQTAPAENGIWVVVASGAASRSTDSNESAEVTSGLYTFVSEGTESAGTGFVLITADPIILGTTSLVFTAFSGAGQIIAGNGLSESGNTLSINTAVTVDLSTAQTLTNKSISGGQITSAVANATLAATATALQTARTIGGTSFDGTANITISSVEAAAGTALLPSIAASGDLNTGMWFPAADTVAVSTVGSERFRIDSSGNVGVGTSTPTEKLEISGNILATALFFRSSGTSIKTDQTTAAYMSFSLTNAEIMRLARISTNAGQLHMTQYSTGSTAAGYPAYSFTSDTDTGLFSPGSDALGFSTGGVEVGRLDSNGRMLFGLTTARTNFNNIATNGPKLQIEGIDNNGASMSIVQSSNAAAITPALYFGRQRSGGIGGNTIVQNGDLLGAIAFQGNDGSEMVSGASIQAFVAGTPGANAMPGRLVFSTTPDGAVTPVGRVMIDKDGNIGVGTDSPSSILNLAANNPVITFTDTVNTNVATMSVVDGNMIFATDITNQQPSSTIRFAIDGSEIIRIGASNLGIGTAAPNANAILDVASTTKAFMPPRMTTTQKNAIASPTAGMMVYDSTLNKLSLYTTAWETVTSI